VPSGLIHGAFRTVEKRLRLESCNRDADRAAQRCKLIVSLLSHLMGSIPAVARVRCVRVIGGRTIARVTGESWASR